MTNLKPGKVRKLVCRIGNTLSGSGFFDNQDSLSLKDADADIFNMSQEVEIVFRAR